MEEIRADRFGWNPGDMRSPDCSSCTRYYRGRLVGEDIAHARGTCEAFPNGIPREIETGQVQHRKPYEGDNGKQFKPTAAAKKKEKG